MTKLSRWIGILEVEERPFSDESPIFYEENDPFVVRFEVKTLSLELAAARGFNGSPTTRDFAQSNGRERGPFPVICICKGPPGPGPDL